MFQQNFAFSGKPLIFSTQWGLFCGWWHCWISVTSQNKVAILASRLGFIKNLRLTCKITHNYLRCIILSTSFTFSVEKSWQLQKTSGADVLLPRKKIRKTLRHPHPPPPRTSEGKICLVFLKHYRKTVFDPRQEKNFFFYINYREQSFNEKTFCKNNRTAPMLKSRKFHSWFWLHDSLFSRVCLLIHLLRQKKIFAGINSKTWSFNKHMEISSAVERMVLHGGSKLGKNETYDADTLIIHDTACAHIFISTTFYTL